MSDENSWKHLIRRRLEGEYFPKTRLNVSNPEDTRGDLLDWRLTDILMSERNLDGFPAGGDEM